LLFSAWKDWCEDNNLRAASKQVFGKELRATLPLLRTSQPRDEHGSNKTRYYVGVSLKSSGRNAEERVSARVSGDPGDLTRADTRENPLRPQQLDMSACAADCGEPMTIITPGQKYHPGC
jgi:hypothetical protein